MNIPIYRAKKISSDEYVEGFYCQDFIICSVQIDRDDRVFQIQEGYEIDITTLAIHLPDMLDNQGNKIFASLSEDGKGGDIVEDYIGKNHYYGTVFIQNGGMTLRTNYNGKAEFLISYTYVDIEAGYKGVKIIGIQD